MGTNFLDDSTLKAIGVVLGAVVATLGAGAGARSWLSGDKRNRAEAQRDVAKAGAESDFFGSALTEAKLEIASWKLDSEYKRKRIRDLERRNAILTATVTFQASQLSFARKLAVKYPELEQFLPSDRLPMMDDQPTDFAADPFIRHKPSDQDR